MAKRNNVIEADKVFLAFRTDIFGIEDEHVTIAYLGDRPSQQQMMDAIAKWEDKFNLLEQDVRIAVNGFANWKSSSGYFNVALVTFPDNKADISFSKNWHITLEKEDAPVEPIQLLEEHEEYQDFATEMFVGYKIKGERYWAPANTVWPDFQPTTAWKEEHLVALSI